MGRAGRLGVDFFDHPLSKASTVDGVSYFESS